MSSTSYQKPSICFYIMNFIFLLYVVLVNKLCLSKPYYSGPGYTNDRESDNSAVASSHQKKRLLSDESSQMQDAPSGYDSPNKYRKYQASADPQFMRRESRLDHDQSDFDADGKERRDFYDGSNAAAKDSSIEVILDPRAKKAVAVVENSPNGQAMYDLTGWKNGALDNQENQEQVVNLVYPAERSSGSDKIQRKYNAETYDARKFADNYESSNGDTAKAPIRERSADVNEQTAKKKRNVDVAKAQNIADSDGKLTDNTVKRSVVIDKRKASDLQSSKMDEKQNDCPPHSAPQTSDNKIMYSNGQTEVKREVQHWSQEQMTALQNSLAKANEDSSEMNNLKAMLLAMGLMDNTQKREVAEKELQNDKEPIIENKREAQASADLNEDDDLNQDDAMLKRNDRAISDDEKWEMDVNSAPQEPIEKREINEEKDEAEKKRSNEETANVDTDNSNSPVLEANAREKRQNIDKKEENVPKDTSKLAAIPSAANENLTDKKFNKRETEENTKKEKRKLLDGDEYEKQMENQIQAKIDAIKEQVKREIFEDQQRKRVKRFTNSKTNLGESYNFKPYLRSRRNINIEKSKIANNNEKSSKSNTRKKRANIVQEKQMIYRPFQTEQDEETELDGDFDDNKLYLQKRQAGDEDCQYFDSRSRDDSPYMQSYYPQSRNRRSFENDYVDDSVPFHDGGMISNKAVMKSREKFRDSSADQDTANANEINDSEYFGSLPLSYNGELTRYKRVKRDNPYN